MKCGFFKVFSYRAQYSINHNFLEIFPQHFVNFLACRLVYNEMISEHDIVISIMIHNTNYREVIDIYFIPFKY